MNDFIIVGRGLAAATLMHRFSQSGLSFKTIGNASLSKASRIAAGIWNPIVFKRMTKSWMAETLVDELFDFYPGCEKKLNASFFHPRPIVKPFIEEQEKNLWRKKSINELTIFLDKQFLAADEDFKNCSVPGELGKVLRSGFVNTEVFLEASDTFFEPNIIAETFDYTLLKISPEGVEYKSVKAKNIVFCEGYLIKNNPYFNWLPLKPAKGETLTIEAPGLQLHNHIFNRNGFILRLPNGSFKLGATYAWQNLNDEPGKEGEKELLAKLDVLINEDYRVLRHDAGVRPSSVDRRPLIGKHPEHKNLFVFNGLGTKGVMLAPYFSKKFVHFYLQNEELSPEVNVQRFLPLYEAAKKNKT